MFWSWSCPPRRCRNAARPSPLRAEVLEDRTLPATLIPGFTESTFASGLKAPTAMTFAADGRIFVTEKTGNIRVVQNGQLLATPFASVSVNAEVDRGVLGIALDPYFANNGFVYVFYTTNDPNPVGRVSRFTANHSNTSVALPGSEVILLDGMATGADGIRCGGALQFGPDGLLYVGVGEPTGSNMAQDLSSLLGKVLRIQTTPGDLIPASNPFVNTPGARGEIWAIGFRNPFTFNVDPANGRFYINDVGDFSFEEVNELVKGGNFGWPAAEGYGNNPAYIEPIHAYPHAGKRAAISGGVFSRGTPYPQAFQGGYFFADFSQKVIRYLPEGSSQPVDFATNADRPVDLDIGPDNRLYYLSVSKGTIIRIDVQTDFRPTPRIVATPNVGGQVHLFDANNGALQRIFTPYVGYFGSVRVATADVNRDGFTDIITAPGTGASGHVKVFDGVSFAELSSFYAYDPANTVGVQLAAGDLNGDGFAEVVTGVDGGGPHVKAFDIRNGAALIRDFFAFEARFFGGVRVAVGDTDGDGSNDIIVAAGVGGNGHVKVFDGQTLAEMASFFAFPGEAQRQGVWIAAGDIDGDGRTEVLIGAGTGEPPHVRVFGISGGVTTKASFDAFGGFTGGVRVSVVDADGDGDKDIVACTATAVSHVKAFDPNSLAELRSFLAFDAPGMFVAGG